MGHPAQARNGTVEIRVLDTPLTIERAAQPAAYAQTLAHYVLTQRLLPVSADIYLVYRHNRFQAWRYGFDATYVDAYTQRQVPMQQDLLQTLDTLIPHAAEIRTAAALETLRADITARRSDAAWLRAIGRRWAACRLSATGTRLQFSSV